MEIESEEFFDDSTYVRQTSIEVYRKITENGLLSKLLLEVYSFLYHHGPCTAVELFYKMGWHNTSSNHNIASKLGTLRDRGAVVELGKRPCNITGNTVIVWDCSDKVPSPPTKEETNKEKVKRLSHLLNWIVKKYPELREEIVQKSNELKAKK